MSARASSSAVFAFENPANAFSPLVVENINVVFQVLGRGHGAEYFVRHRRKRNDVIAFGVAAGLVARRGDCPQIAVELGCGHIGHFAPARGGQQQHSDIGREAGGFRDGIERRPHIPDLVVGQHFVLRCRSLGFRRAIPRTTGETKSSSWPFTSYQLNALRT